jgi:hypothetical protein
MGGSPNYNYPAQPSYGEGMADAMKAQMEMLTGQTLGKGEGFKELYASALGEEGGTLADVLRKFEAPLRKETAQIDTDVMRQTILGGSQEVVLDKASGKYGIPGAEIVTSEQTGSDAPTQTAGGRYQMVYRPTEDAYTIIDTQTGGLISADDTMDWLVEKEYINNAGDRNTYGRSENLPQSMLDAGYGSDKRVGEDPRDLAVMSAHFQDLNESVTAAAADQGVPESEVKLEFEFTDPNTGKPLQEGDVVREGTGMVDLLGDTRQVQEQTRSEDYAQYVKDNPDLQADFNAKRQAGDDVTIEEYGQDHYERHGKAEGRELAMGEYSLQDAGRQAGFDESGQFRGLSALAEDIGRGGQQRAREADIADVERLGGRATDAYRAQGDMSGALAQARAMGAGGSKLLSAIPKDPLFTGTAIGTLADRAKTENLNISAISGGRMGDYDPLSLPGQAGQAGQAGSALAGPVQPGQPALGTAQPGGIDAFRSALMTDARGALDQGLTAREKENIEQALRARQTGTGRVFDSGSIEQEVQAKLLEDRNRQMQNRAFAQRALGQEVGIQQADLTRGLQAQQLELGRQSAGVDRQLTAEEKDIERIMRQQAMEEQYRQQGLGAERASAAQMVGLEQATSADPFQAILQRQGQNNLGAGGALFGQAGYGLESGPQYLNPEAGLGFIQNQATNAANMYGAQLGADATRTAGMWSGIGSVLGGGLSGYGAFKACWVAREVYGAHNPAWLDFRHWMFSSAPRWFFKLYLAFGERFANFISDKPRLKARIRMWMDTKIGR